MLKRLLRETRGQSLVELALVLPVLLLLLLGVMEAGRIFSGYVELQNAARDAARYAAVNPVMGDQVKQYIKDHSLTILNGSKLDQAGNFSFANRNSKSPDPLPSTKDREWVEVDLKYQIDVITPIIGTILGNQVNISAHMVMRTE